MAKTLNPGICVSSESETPNVGVYERSEQDGLVSTLLFNNLEWRDYRDTKDGLKQLLALASIFTAGYLCLNLSATVKIHYGGWAQAGLWLAGFIFIATVFDRFFVRPVSCEKALQFYWDENKVEKYTDKKFVGEFMYGTPFPKLTVQVHPDGIERKKEKQRPESTHISHAEKTHVLIAWHGIGQAIQHFLVHRAEYPNHNSLLEVRSAILWAYERYRTKAHEGNASHKRTRNENPPED